VSATAFEHTRQQQTGQLDRPTQVDRQHVVDIRGCVCVEWAERITSRVVDQHVNLAESLGGGRDQSDQARAITQIGRHGDHLGAGRRDLRCDLLELLTSACCRHQTRLKLQEAGEQDTVGQRCAEYYTWRCRRSAKEARYRLVEWFAWINLEIDNIRAVLHHYLVQGDVERGIDLANSLGWYWITHATSEGARWLDQLLAPEASSTTVAHARASFLRGFLAVLQVDATAARTALARARAAARELGELRVLSESLSMASIVENMAGDRAAARRLLDEARAATMFLDDVPVSLTFLQARALHGIFVGDVDAVRSASSEGARLSREVGDLYTLQHMLINLGLAELIAGEPGESAARCAEALRIARQIDDRVAQFYVLGGLGCGAATSGKPRLAAQLLGAAESLRAEVGASANAMLASLLPRAQESAMAVLGASRFEVEFEAGRHLGRDAAVRLALGEPAQHAARIADHAGTGLLGNREAEVARLVAQGLSNKQIAERLFISEHTVDSHIRNILNKLGVNSRAQIASWMAASNR